jgi:hypothetical protein
MGAEKVVGAPGGSEQSGQRAGEGGGRQAERADRLRLASFGVGAELLRLDDLERGSPHLCFRVEEGRPLLVGSEGEAELVVAGRFGELVEEVLRRLGQGGFVALEGPRGVGKSALALYCAWLALKRGLALALLRAERLAAGSTLISKIAGEAGGRLLVLYDPSPLRAGYEPVVAGGEGGGDLERALRVLLRLAGEGRVAAIAVLPEGWAGLLSPELRGRLERFTLRVDLGDPRFLEGVVKAYSGCAGDLRGLAEMLKGLEEGCTLAAKYAGLWLREKGCRPEAVEEALRGAAGSAKLFVASYIWSVVLRGNEGELARRVALPLLIRALSGPIPEGVTYLTRAVRRDGSWRIFEPAAEGVELEDLREADLEPVARWFAARREDLVEEALRELCGVERGLRPAPGHPRREFELLSELQRWAVGELLREEGGLPAPDALLDFVGRRFERALDIAAPACWRRLVMIAGAAFAGSPLVPREAPSLPSEALAPCEVDRFLLVARGAVPPLILFMVENRTWHGPGEPTYPLARWHREAAEEVKRLEKTWREKGVSDPSELLYALGLALAVAKAVRHGKAVEAWEAEAALSAAAGALGVSSPARVTLLLKAFKPLRRLAPHCYVALVAQASRLVPDCRAAYEALAALEETLREHGEELRARAWPLVEAVSALSNLVIGQRWCFLSIQEPMVARMYALLRGLGGELRVMAEVAALAAALEAGLRPPGVDLRNRAEELLAELERMEEGEPSREVADWAETLAFEPVELRRRVVRALRRELTFALAKRLVFDGDLDAAAKRFAKAVLIVTGPETWFWDLLRVLSWVARCSVLKAGSVSELASEAKGFEDAWEKTEGLRFVATHFDVAMHLAEYLAYLALAGRGGEASKLLEEEQPLLRSLPCGGVELKLLLKALEVEVGELTLPEVAAALSEHVDDPLRPAFRALAGLAKDAEEECKALEGERRETCRLAVSAVGGSARAAAHLKRRLLRELDEYAGARLRESADAGEREAVERFRRELHEFVEERDAASVVQLFAPRSSLGSFALMLRAFVNGDGDLARALAKHAYLIFKGRLLRRLFREAAEARSGDELKLALLKLFYLYI